MTLNKNAKIAIITILSILFFDQLLKIWVHTHMGLYESKQIIGDFFQFHYILNNGMAFGMELGGNTGKLLLSLFRIIAIGAIGWYLVKLIKRNEHWSLILSISFIFAGAFGNIIDSMFYGILFQDAPFLFGKVIDMLYFEIINTRLPEWIPIKGGDEFIFFRPVFNIADSAITVGVGIILIFQRHIFKDEK